MGFIKEFKEFAMRGNVIDMAVGIVIGAAFGRIVSSLVSDIVMPPIGYMTSGVEFKDLKYVMKDGVPASTGADGSAVAAVPEVAINYGSFINTIIDFMIVAFAIFVVIKMMNTAKKRFEKKQAEVPAGPPELSTDQKLLSEIRDLLRARA